VTSRFQVLRKHINSSDILNVGHLPFCSWECLTITTRDESELELVIKDQAIMDKFLLFLAWKTDSMTGLKGTALDLKQLMIKERLAKIHKAISPKAEQLVRQEVDHIVAHNVLLMYKVLRVRAKISFRGLRSQKSIQEMFYANTVRTYCRFNPMLKEQCFYIMQLFKRSRIKTVEEGLQLLTKA
jgi:hypothetical protein